MGAGGKFLKAWSKTMEILALSSGESELGALVKACTEGLGIKSLLADFDTPVQVKILSDYSGYWHGPAHGLGACTTFGYCRSLGATGHPERQFHSGQISYIGNGADLMTKVKSRELGSY